MDSNTSIEQYKENVKKHIEELNNILREIAAGNFTVEIPKLDEQDEFAELYFGITLMVSDIQETIKKLNISTKELENTKSLLEEEVKKRTQELEEKVNELSQLNNLMVGRELKMVELKDQIKELQSQLDRTKPLL